MSRGVKDLRDLICVSRLTIHESEDEEVFSEDDSANFNRKFSDTASLLSLSSGPASESGGSKCWNSQIVSPDSGFTTNGSPGNCHSEALSPANENLQQDGCQGVNESTMGRSCAKSDGHAAVREKLHKKGIHVKKTLPLSSSVHGSGDFCELDHNCNKTKPIHESDQRSKPVRRKKRCVFDDILPYMDATIISSWLARSNDAVSQLSGYIRSGDNFVQFSHFWLTEVPRSQKKDLLSMEYDILLDEISLAFAVGQENKMVVRRDILDLCGAVFREYPVQLLGLTNGDSLFLDYLDILTSDKHEQYKTLLSDVQCSTSNRQYAQWLLATRCFALCNMWLEVVNFCLNLRGSAVRQISPAGELEASRESIVHRRVMQAIRHGYIEVIDYFFLSGQVTPTYSDSQGRSLLFTAVMHNQAKVVQHLLAKNLGLVQMNQPTDTGNTALHAACNNGNSEIVELLCGQDGIEVNCVNQQCEGATPLHLAVMHGHTEIVRSLIRHGASPHFLMGETSATDLARDFGHQEILYLLTQTQGVVDNSLGGD